MSPLPEPESVDIFQYIRRTWTVLTRTHAGLAAAAVDPKFHLPPGERWPVYVAASEDPQRIAHTLQAQMSTADFATIQILALPRDGRSLREPGLLYLPNPYVVPGGRFNEMYGWDSYFIEIGLLRDGDLALAKGMVENALYEVREYGKVLNANRTYYLTRSQPPFLASMLLDIYHKTHDRQWLADAVPALEETYRYWTTPPHLVPKTGLSRYYDTGTGPAPEVISSELDRRGRTDYDLVKAYYRQHHHITDYPESRFFDPATRQLTDDFYEGDRSVRESGFDPSNRFGPFSVDIVQYNPVCLNSLLYLMETGAAEILQELGRAADAEPWNSRARDRAAAINRLMWDEKHGLYFDYDFELSRVRTYPFLTTFYPLWVGIASEVQAAAVMRNLPQFERAGGLRTSTYESGDQWDAPYGWAPLQWIAVQAMRRYGYQADADRISLRFLTTVKEQYDRHGVIVEKYNVVHPGAEIGRNLRFGYHSNEVGFGWTNAVFTSLYDQLSQPAQSELNRVK